MIEVKNLSKFFGQIIAVDDISFNVGSGEVLGFLGPNAAGKSTTMRMITGFLPPTLGTAVIGGYDIVEDPIKARRFMGYLPENAPVYGDMTVSSFLRFCAEIRGFKGRNKQKKVEEIIEKCFLSDVKYQSINTLSKGYKQRVCFAQSIIHDPKYLIMDEPTDGLDPNQKHEVRTMIREMAREKTIVLSTHILEEVDAVCTRVVIIARGKIVADDTPQGLKARSPIHGTFRVRVEALPGWSDKDLDSLRQRPGVKEVELLSKNDNQLDLRIYPLDQQINAQQVIGILTAANLTISSLSREEGRLDSVFRMITTSI
ncbi:MAG: ABC transporter ATP-binding protein [Deltaproteobacteria bacterium]|nr:MAG: ABC transporter ATP-binding protein [Deltaproteobacteria bacterium]RLB84954.1 MAG: ABC transporter ATP-binding protein [Deltaproteobacteria bacterium]